MKRREFITLLGGAAAWPLAARAQQPNVFRVGYLEPGSPTDPIQANLRRQFLLGMRDLGYREGRQFTMEDRNAEGHFDRLPALAAELVRLPVDILVVGGEASIRAAKHATDKIPIVMALAADPVGSGVVPSLAHPGGNITGMSALAARQNSTGGKIRLGGITKRGNRYLRRLLINGASANLLRSKATKADPWVIGLRRRRPPLVVAVALANKTARIAWAVMLREKEYQPRAMAA